MHYTKQSILLNFMDLMGPRHKRMKAGRQERQLCGCCSSLFPLLLRVRSSCGQKLRALKHTNQLWSYKTLKY